MRTDRRKNPGKSVLAIIFMFAIGLIGLLGTATVSAQTYIGSDTCGTCHDLDSHPQNFGTWLSSAHPFGLKSGENARHSGVPLPPLLDWAEISYVLGGFQWKTLYLDEDGYFVTSTENGAGSNQYNNMTGNWVDFRAGQSNVSFGDCGGCHTTGWVPGAGQGGLPGLGGSFAEAGVGCEACHGPSAAGPTGSDEHGFVDTSSAQCGQCHSRGSSGVIEVSNGFIDHNQQYSELLASPHKNWDCVACHDPHKAAPFSIKPGRSCEDCHSDKASAYATTNMHSVGVECIDCHMAYATLSAEPKSEFEGDVRTHLFNINSSESYNMFSGAQVARATVNGRANEGSLSVGFACLGCHANEDASWAAVYADGFHSGEFKITPGISGTWVGTPGERDGEGWVIDMTELFVGAFYTQDGNGDTTWMIGFGVPSGNTVTVNLIRADGPAFGVMRTQAQMNETAWGTATFTFTSCTTGTVTFTPNAAMMALGFVSYTTDIAPLLPQSHSCPGLG